MNSKSILTGILCLAFSVLSSAELPQKEHFNCVFQSRDLNAAHAMLEMTVTSIGNKNQEGLYIKVTYSSNWDKQNFERSVPVVVRGANPVLKISNINTPEDSRFTMWDDLHLSIDLENPTKMVVGKKTVSGFLSQAGFSSGQRYIEAEGVCTISQK